LEPEEQTVAAVQAHFQQEQQCERNQFEKPGVSLKEFEMMTNAVPTGQNQNVVDKWKEICSIIFPDRKPPDSPYIGPGHIEFLRVYYQAWRSEGLDYQAIFDVVSEPSALDDADPRVLAATLSDKLQETFNRWLSNGLQGDIPADTLSQRMGVQSVDTRASFSAQGTHLPGVPEFANVPSWAHQDSISYTTDPLTQPGASLNPNALSEGVDDNDPFVGFGSFNGTGDAGGN
jgi:hypothetical protein